MARWTADQVPDQSGRTAIVTGANSGLGLSTARELARHGGHVLVTARSEEKAEGACAAIRDEVEDASLEPRVLDLADLSSVRDFAQGVESLDVLINNAGVMMTPKQSTIDGFDLQFGTNHLGHFALTGLLLDKLKAGDDPRVVTVSSLEHKPGKLDFDDLQQELRYSPRGAYQQSKFANAVFGLELDRRLRGAGLPIKSVLAHPGYSDTNLQFAGPQGPIKAVLFFGNKLFAQSADQGALPQLYAATAPEADSGAFYGPDWPGETRGHPTRVQPVKRARDLTLGQRLWEVSEELTGVRYLSG